MTDNKKIYLKDLKDGSVKTSLMVNKRLYKDGSKMLYILSDKSGYINAKIPMKLKLEPGQVIEIEGVKDYVLDVFQVKLLENYDINDYLKGNYDDYEQGPEVVKQIDKAISDYKMEEDYVL